MSASKVIFTLKERTLNVHTSIYMYVYLAMHTYSEFKQHACMWNIGFPPHFKVIGKANVGFSKVQTIPHEPLTTAKELVWTLHPVGLLIQSLLLLMIALKSKLSFVRETLPMLYSGAGGFNGRFGTFICGYTNISSSEPQCFINFLRNSRVLEKLAMKARVNWYTFL